MSSMGAGPPSLESTTTFGAHGIAPNTMMLPPRSALVSGELLAQNHAGHIPNIPVHSPAGSLHRSLSRTRIGAFSLKQRTPRRPMPLQIAQRRYTTPGTESMQSPLSSGTSAYFSESVMSASPPQSDFHYLPSDRSTMSLHRDDSITGAELPPIPPIPSLEPSRRSVSRPRRPAILSEKSPQRPVHRKPKGPLPPRLVNLNDPKDYKTAQNTVAARGTRQRKAYSAQWLEKYRDETKVYIRDLEATLREMNDRVANLERENQEMRQALSRRPVPEHLARCALYPNSSSSKHGSFDDLPTAGLGNAGPNQHREIAPMQVPGKFPVVPSIPSIEDYLNLMSGQQSVSDNLITEPLTTRLYENSENLAFRQLDSYGSAHDSPQQVASEHPTASDEELMEDLFGDVLIEAGGQNTLAQEPPVTPNTAYIWGVDPVISWAEAQEQLAMDDDEFYRNRWNPDYLNVTDRSGSPQTQQNNEEGPISLQA